MLSLLDVLPLGLPLNCCCAPPELPLKFSGGCSLLLVAFVFAAKELSGAISLPELSPLKKHWQVVLVSIGCFDPPTYLHLRMFELARDALISEGHHVLGGYMSPINDLQGKTVTPAEHRIKMCQLATTDSHFIMVDQWEAKQNFPQKATSVLSKLENALGTSDYYPEEKIRVMLLCGSDVLESFATAGTNADQIEALCDEHGIVCISRDGNSIRKCIYDHDFLYENKRNIIVVDDWISNGNTSSKVRQLITRGFSVKYLTHDSVIRYISLNSLYSAENATI